jgi:MFS superfamily sulfate permease-like transporter
MSAALTVVAGALADLAIGLAIAYRPTSRYGLYAAIVISFAYAIIGTILVPRLWADPLGPMLKIWPIIVLHFVALAVIDDR